MARASTATHLSLDRFAAILGLNPMHFNGGASGTLFPAYGSCKNIWQQYAWQMDVELVSREDIARTIATVERDIKNILHYAVAPEWETREYHAWPGNSRSGKTIQTEYGKIIAGGQRVSNLIEGGVAVVYSDQDGDGWDETATVTVNTTVEDNREIKVYFAGESGAPEWEIRTPRSIVIAGGVATITLDAWLMFDPALAEAYPTQEEPEPIDPFDAANFVSTIDVYHVYNDATSEPVRFYSSPNRLDYAYYACAFCDGAGCGVCNVSTQDGCFTVMDANSGLVQPYPATYDADAGRWISSYMVNCSNPNQVSLNYYAGNIDQSYRLGRSLDPLSDYLAEAIAWMTVARLPQKVCACNYVSHRVEEWQRDLSIFGLPDGRGYSRFQNMTIFKNPFGTRKGEVMAYERVANIMGDQVLSGGLL